MILIFCNNEDYVANALYLHLKQKTEKVRLVNAEELVFAKSWVHQCEKDGVFTTEIILPDGYIISSENTSCIFNRIRFFPTTHFINQQDFAYAQIEFYALYASFLESMNDKLFEKLHTHHLSLTDYETYCIKAAIEAGVPVQDESFSTITRAYPTAGNIFIACDSAYGIKYKKWAYAVAPDVPYIVKNKTEGNYCKAIIAGDQIILPPEIKKLEKKIMSFAKKISRSFMELSFGKTANGYRLMNTDIFPVWASEEVVTTIADQLIKKLNL